MSKELRTKIEEITVDFGYAEGDLGEDCKNDAVDQIMQAVSQATEIAELKAQIAVLDYVNEPDGVANYPERIFMKKEALQKQLDNLERGK